MDAELSKARSVLRYADAISTEAQRKMALLNQEGRQLRARISGLQAILKYHKKHGVNK
ncbi:hypothetical protein N9567_03255 [Planktomarina temperata]|nr:hypothetical protein [Planktomarina temperata]MDC0929980.1 hypothetical protein [Planktomarina temperata]